MNTALRQSPRVGEFVPRGCVRPAVMDARLRVSEGKLQFLPLILPAALSSIPLSCSQRLCRVRTHLKTSRVRPCLPVLDDRCGFLPRFSQFSANQVSLDDRFPISFLILVAQSIDRHFKRSLFTADAVFCFLCNMGHTDVSEKHRGHVRSLGPLSEEVRSTCDLILISTLKDRRLKKKKKQQLFLI